MSKRQRVYETEHAQRGAGLVVSLELATKGSFEDLAPSLTAPESSTGGGVRAHQHVVLTAPSGATLVVGSANSVERTAELKTLGLATSLAERRSFGAKLPPLEYLAFLERATKALEEAGLTVTVVAFEKPELEERAAASPPSRGARFYAVVFASVIGGCAAVGFLLARCG
jgi:hypothetical protein